MTALRLVRRVLSWETWALIAVLGAVVVAAAAKDVALISNKSNALPGIALADLLKVCKGQMGKWSDGKPVTIVMRQPGSPDLRIVEQKIYALSSAELRELIATANHGRLDRPAIILGGSDEEIIHKVESMPGAVGLVDVYSITGAVQVVKVGGKCALEVGYPQQGE